MRCYGTRCVMRGNREFDSTYVKKEYAYPVLRNAVQSSCTRPYALAYVLHFAIVAICATRRTSFKRHSRRVIRLYVTRSLPASSSMLWKCLELSSEGNSVCRRSFLRCRAREELLSRTFSVSIDLGVGNMRLTGQCILHLPTLPGTLSHKIVTVKN